MPSEFTREDYEHAARAAGLEIEWSDGSYWVRARQWRPWVEVWKPEKDNDQTLRLALKLGMHINIEGMEIGYRLGGVLCIERIVLRDAGLEAAVCEAIFRAAIEIGKSLKGTP